MTQQPSFWRFWGAYLLALLASGIVWYLLFKALGWLV